MRHNSRSEKCCNESHRGTANGSRNAQSSETHARRRGGRTGRGQGPGRSHRRAHEYRRRGRWRPLAGVRAHGRREALFDRHRDQQSACRGHPPPEHGPGSQRRRSERAAVAGSRDREPRAPNADPRRTHARSERPMRGRNRRERGHRRRGHRSGARGRGRVCERRSSK